jgi:hypothetical protein
MCNQALLRPDRFFHGAHAYLVFLLTTRGLEHFRQLGKCLTSHLLP